jgi:hypothetical protein
MPDSCTRRPGPSCRSRCTSGRRCPSTASCPAYTLPSMPRSSTRRGTRLARPTARSTRTSGAPCPHTSYPPACRRRCTRRCCKPDRCTARPCPTARSIRRSRPRRCRNIARCRPSRSPSTAPHCNPPGCTRPSAPIAQWRRMSAPHWLRWLSSRTAWPPECRFPSTCLRCMLGFHRTRRCPTRRLRCMSARRCPSTAYLPASTSLCKRRPRTLGCRSPWARHRRRRPRTFAHHCRSTAWRPSCRVRLLLRLRLLRPPRIPLPAFRRCPRYRRTRPAEPRPRPSPAVHSPSSSRPRRDRCRNREDLWRWSRGRRRRR